MRKLQMNVEFLRGPEDNNNWDCMLRYHLLWAGLFSNPKHHVKKTPQALVVQTSLKLRCCWEKVLSISPSTSHLQCEGHPSALNLAGKSEDLMISPQPPLPSVRIWSSLATPLRWRWDIVAAKGARTDGKHRAAEHCCLTARKFYVFPVSVCLSSGCMGLFAQFKDMSGDYSCECECVWLSCLWWTSDLVTCPECVLHLTWEIDHRHNFKYFCWPHRISCQLFCGNCLHHTKLPFFNLI